MRRAVLTLATCLTAVSAWTTPQNSVVTRQAFWQSAAAVAVVAASAPVQAETLPNGVTYEVKKKGDGPQPEIGELAAIRFAAYNGANKIDDIFETPEPYYTRIGSGGLLKGVEETLPLMRLGDRWELTIPSELAFGKKGRPASAGKPRIAGDAVITFDVEMVGLPGREIELIELIGD
ncbi:peptidylprolyl isomerase [Fistulifera solaris]|uniref:peptidylprolyl isomerase n=1 Tax=Fistulifera solaris TaxID=1519565 RepID=A0A1Z5JG23_FISSO|nr:peptidylprolyl isomerase [Fistulifera solaris]|eukprot:GAX12950.1 peptidylprolyl isomerase [Fistulifera solaris]